MQPLEDEIDVDGTLVGDYGHEITASRNDVGAVGVPQRYDVALDDGRLVLADSVTRGEWPAPDRTTFDDATGRAPGWCGRY